MNKRSGTTLSLLAASGLLAGLAGCGGAAKTTDPAAAPGPTPSASAAAGADKNGCKGAPGEKHGCGGDHEAGEKHDEKPADAPK